MKITSFEDYLRNVHAKQYEGLDDDMPDDFDSWVTNLDAEEMYELAKECVQELVEPQDYDSVMMKR